MASATAQPFLFPPHYAFPPFFTLQPNPQTRLSQLQTWSALIQSYCRHQKLYTLSLDSATLSSALFSNTTLKRRLSPSDARAVLDWMASPEGGRRVEWITGSSAAASSAALAAADLSATAATTSATSKGAGSATRCFVYWRRPEEWSAVIYGWVEETGQQGSVLTFFEITEGDASRGKEFYGIDREVLKRAMGVLVKQGKAQVFGQEDGLGVKFF